MAIYSRCGSVVTIQRPVTTLGEVMALENRKTDKHDQSRLHLNQYCVIQYADDGRQVLADLALLRADEGAAEIYRAARAVGCDV